MEPAQPLLHYDILDVKSVATSLSLGDRVEVRVTKMSGQVRLKDWLIY